MRVGASGAMGGRTHAPEAEVEPEPEAERPSVQCTAHCSVALQQQLVAAVAELGWSVKRPPVGRRQAAAVAPYLAASVVWHEGEQGKLTPQCQASQLLPHQWLSRIIGLGALTEKDSWERLLRDQLAAQPGQSVRSPRTLLLPEQGTSLAELAERGTYIAKPSQGSQGSNIVLLRGRTEVERWWAHHQEHSQCPDDLRYVLQDYLDDPLMLRGHKFDLRLYLVCVCPMSVLPLECCFFG
eukprot:COSAG02_NODE_1302_length_13358_cov_12.308243_1_plen_239_part_00